MSVVFPRPDSETNSWERNRLQPSNVPLRFPIEVLGGVRPLHFTCNSGCPSGMVIDADLPDDWATNGLQNYGVVRWDNPLIGTYSLDFLVQDQDGHSIHIAFTLNVVDKNNTANFLWFDSINGNDSTGNGSYSTPWKTDLTKALGATSTSVTTQGHVILKPGSYTLPTHSDLSAGQMSFDSTKRPVIVYGMPTNSTSPNLPTLSFNSSQVYFGTMTGMYFGDLAMDGGETSFANYTNILIGDSQDRLGFFNLSITNPTNGTTGNDNTTFAGFASGATSFDATYNHYVFFRGVTETGRPLASNSAAICDMYGVKNAVFEDDAALSTSANNLITPKDSSQNMTFAYNRFPQKISGDEMAFDVLGVTQNGGHNGNIEYVYNRGASASGAGGRALRVNAFAETAFGNFWSSRNTWLGGIDFKTPNAGGPFVSENDVIQATTSIVETGSQVSVTGTECQNSSGIIDGSFNLIGSCASTWLYQRGYQIGGNVNSIFFRRANSPRIGVRTAQ